MKILTAIILIFAFSSCTLDVRNESVITNAKLDCSNAPPGTQLQCQREFNTTVEKILNDGGTITSVDEIESSGRCSRYAVSVEYGKENPTDKKMKRVHNISVCSGSFLSYIWNNIEISAGSAIFGFFAGFAAAMK